MKGYLVKNIAVKENARASNGSGKVSLWLRHSEISGLGVLAPVYLTARNDLTLLASANLSGSFLQGCFRGWYWWGFIQSLSGIPQSYPSEISWPQI